MIRWVVAEAERDAALGALVIRAGGDARAIADGRVFVGLRRATSEDQRVQPGDEIAIAPPREVTDVRILASTADLVAAEKPAGMPTIADQSGRAHTLHEAVARAMQIDASRLHPTSRLDRDVSGIVVFSLSSAATARLKQARENGTYARRYVALAVSSPSLERGTWDAPIGRAGNPRTRIVGGRDASPASSRFAVIARTPACVLLALAPVTGRTHQLRVHASHAGAPLLGDPTYGGPARLTLGSGRVLALGRVALHAARVSVPQARGDALVVKSAVPEELIDLWRTLGGEGDAWDRALADALA